MKSAEYWIERLALKKHPEGGYFRETYRSNGTIKEGCLPDRFKGTRPFSTAIYFLLRGHEFSTLHRIKSDELWHFYTGVSLTIHIIDRNSRYFQVKLGNDFDNGEVFQTVVNAGYWFGATINDPQSYSLAGCTVSPGFDFCDLELANRRKLIDLYPEHKAIIEKLTR